MPSFLFPSGDNEPEEASLRESIFTNVREEWSDAARKAAAAGRAARKSGKTSTQSKHAALKAYIKAGGKRGKNFMTSQVAKGAGAGDRSTAGLRSRIRRYNLKSYRSGTSVDHYKAPNGQVHSYNITTKKWSLGKVHASRKGEKRRTSAQKRAASYVHYD